MVELLRAVTNHKKQKLELEKQDKYQIIHEAAI